ncbi:MAG TPA: hypothetical protein VFS25_19405 [Chitinophaga sp.]|uniref:hypothetical protein n=1 Tax=Chitinophaga sp. TaxID=1869181 RepID=UPI002DB6C3C3|nr:hypothetical protein [Chitinophaga sp.]HEU4555027.1 hypothetical protein [Chitinophaga sp.]
MQKAFLIFSILCAAGLSLQAQSKPAKGKTPAAQTAGSKTAATHKTNLRFRSTWGVFLSDTLPRPEVLKLLDSSLVVRDQQNHTYPVVSFDFTYEKKEPYLNDSTGQPGIYTEYTGDTFQSDKLPPLWTKHLKEVLQRDEVLYFDNIVIKYSEEKYYRAPQLKIVVR